MNSAGKFIKDYAKMTYENQKDKIANKINDEDFQKELHVFKEKCKEQTKSKI